MRRATFLFPVWGISWLSSSEIGKRTEEKNEGGGREGHQSHLPPKRKCCDTRHHACFESTNFDEVYERL
jgi:hypothetical protein